MGRFRLVDSQPRADYSFCHGPSGDIRVLFAAQPAVYQGMVLDGGCRDGRALWRFHDLFARVALRITTSRHLELFDLVGLFGPFQSAVDLLPTLGSVECLSRTDMSGPTFNSVVVKWYPGAATKTNKSIVARVTFLTIRCHL